MNLAIESASVSTRRKLRFGHHLKSALLGGMAAAAGNFAVYFVARALGVPFIGAFDPSGTISPLPPVAIAVSSLLPALLGGAVFALLAAFTKRPTRNFVGLAVVLTLLSFGPPLTVAGASLGTRLSLALMHVVAFAFVVGTLVRRNRLTARH